MERRRVLPFRRALVGNDELDLPGSLDKLCPRRFGVPGRKNAVAEVPQAFRRGFQNIDIIIDPQY